MKVEDVEVVPCGCGEPWNGDWDWGKRRDKTGPQFICAGCGARGEVQTEKRDAALAWNAMWQRVDAGPATISWSDEPLKAAGYYLVGCNSDPGLEWLQAGDTSQYPLAGPIRLLDPEGLMGGGWTSEDDDAVSPERGPDA